MSEHIEPAFEFDDVQAIVRFGHGHLTAASFLLMRVKDADAARAWLATAPVSIATTTTSLPSTAMQVAFTSEGLRALGIDQAIVDGFSPEFIVGLGGDAARSRRLGDVGANDPSRWNWGVGDRLPHVMVLLYATADAFDAWQAQVLGECGHAFEQIECLGTADFGGVEPFGFTDGISQPLVDWERERPAEDVTRLEYANRVCVGEFLLGYPNEYGGYSDRPLLERARDPSGLLPMADDEPDKSDFGRNGSYLVMRQLRQDVGGFWRFLDRQAEGDAALRTRWAEAMVGRKLDGTPLVGRTGEVIAGSVPPKSGPDQNAFTYRSDREGLKCPFGAHVRRSNPRNADLPADTAGLLQRLIRMLGLDAAARGDDMISSTRFHRVLRRGREYGAKLSPDQALVAQATAPDSGLHFMCLNANIARQFEFIQGAWLMSAKFNGMRDERDPVLGHRLPGPDGLPVDAFSIPQVDGPSERLTNLPEFVTVAGGAYFFLPGIRALRYIASSPSSASSVEPTEVPS
jgi:deferrochelatase/peroxidase EfeB